MRSDLETVKIVNRKYDINTELFLQLKAIEGDMTINCSRKDLD